MNRIDDPRVVFYLRHQVLIDEWAALAGNAAAVAHSFLCSCADDVDTLASELGARIRTYKPLEGDWPKLALVVPRWAGKGHDADPRLAIGLEWHRTATLGFSVPQKCAYTGVWVNYTLDGGPELSKKLRSAFADAGVLREYQLTSSSWWPAHRREEASGEYWNDLAPYRAQLLDSIRFFWQTFTPIIQEVVRK